MKVIVAVDSFKESMTSLQAGESVKRGVTSACPDADVIVLPVADGGEGTIDALIHGLGGEIVKVKVHGPLEETLEASYGIIDNLDMAVIEIAQIVGLPLVAPELRNPMRTSTYGLGETILDAMDRGCRNFIVGLGGSSTNDAGVGMLSALGYRFYDRESKPTGNRGKDVGRICGFDSSRADKRLGECVFHIAVDVNNPLYGPNGAAAVFGPQKGASAQDVEALDSAMVSFASVVSETLGPDVSQFPGTGAAGGLGFAFLAFLNSELKCGVDVVLNAVKLEEHVKDADFVITGEGRIDNQTVMGKAPVGVARLAKKYGATVIAFCGAADSTSEICNRHGIDAYFPIMQKPLTLREALKRERAQASLEATAKQTFLLVSALKKQYGNG